MIPFDIDQAPLKGVHLIEAGAGTGKTYTIATLYLRLIVEQGLAVDQILVVTYTKAAAEELKTRIRGRLVWAKNGLAREKTDDRQLVSMLERVGDIRCALRRVSDALIDFDQAAIFTIHGFCQRVLHHFAFETGHLFKSELVQEAQPFIQESADDFWRRHVSRAPVELVSFILSQVKGPEELALLFHRRRSPLATVIPSAIKPPLTAIRHWREACRQIKIVWEQQRSQVVALLSSEGLNGRIYGVCSPDKKTPDSTKRQIVVAALASAMDLWKGKYPPFKHFDRFSADCLAKATKKNQTTPRHLFFDLCNQAMTICEEMEHQMAIYWRYLKVRLLEEFHQRLDSKKRTANILFFDDLLLQVRRALLGEQQAHLSQAIREKFQAALVDEFQDTDPLQYDIFVRLFGGAGSLFFMIGDPKQAIYSFRGADLFSYLRAKDAAGSQYTLTRNYRCTPALVQALNAIFGNRSQPFGYEKIPYLPAVAAHADPNPDATPFRLWYLTRNNTSGGDEENMVRPFSQQEAVDRIVAAVAEEIVILLSAKEDTFSPEDLAVLTRTHRQAQQIKAALARKGVPAVLYSAGSVFDTREAGELNLVLEAVANPADPRRVRSALSGDLFGVSGQEICDYMENPGPEWDCRWAQFDTYHHMWLRHGFYRMLSHLMAREGVRQRLLSLPNGERRLTNCLHLAELLHRAAVEHQFGPEGLLKWFAQQRSQGAQDEEAQKLRLESDARAVRVITIHKSKGLQFKVVFCPFTWAGVKTNDDAVNFHDPAHHDRLTLAVGPNIEEQHKRLALKEELTENLRMLYVALTRAQQRCYMAWGSIKGAELSAPAYLLHAPTQGCPQSDWITALQGKMAAMTDAQLIKELHALAQSAGGTIAVEPLPDGSKAMYHHVHPTTGMYNCRQSKLQVHHPWRMASFSSLTADRPLEQDDRPDRDDALGMASGQSDPASGVDAPNLFAFPKGTRAGLFFHDLLEHWDFSNPDVNRRRHIVAEKLASHGLEQEWLHAVDLMLERLSTAKLPSPEAVPIHLCDIALGRRVNEMEFYFPLRTVTTDQLKHTIREWGGPSVSEYARQLERMTFAPVEGFMKGYMDMVFEHGGRYYLVDWKSNYLGDSWDDYDSPALKRAMTLDYYFLQYYLYVVALDQLLRQRISDYRYDQHFGGVYYLFLRGIQGEGKSTGIYHDKPDTGLVEGLNTLLIDHQTRQSYFT